MAILKVNTAKIELLTLHTVIILLVSILAICTSVSETKVVTTIGQEFSKIGKRYTPAISLSKIKE